ncbi:MAG TPA: hypothetical protein VGH00_02605, partial [Chthoniobacterales bacterium]
RATVLEICHANSIPCEESDLEVDDLYRAAEMFCTGTMGELAGVITLDGRTIGDGQIGPMTKRLSTFFALRTASEGEHVAAKSG